MAPRAPVTRRNRARPKRLELTSKGNARSPARRPRRESRSATRRSGCWDRLGAIAADVVAIQPRVGAGAGAPLAPPPLTGRRRRVGVAPTRRLRRAARTAARAAVVAVLQKAGGVAEAGGVPAAPAPPRAAASRQPRSSCWVSCAMRFVFGSWLQPFSTPVKKKWSRIPSGNASFGSWAQSATPTRSA